MLDGDLDLGPVTGTYYRLFEKEISNIPTVTPSLFNQTRRITTHNVSVTRYKSVIKNRHDWSPASTNSYCRNNVDLVPLTCKSDINLFLGGNIIRFVYRSVSLKNFRDAIR